MLRELFGPPLLLPGGTYYAKLQLTGLESMLGSASAVRDKLTEGGFRAVTVWSKNPPADFPDRSTYPDGSTYWARGVWGGARETKSLPGQVKRVWTSADDAPTPVEDPPAKAPEASEAPEPVDVVHDDDAWGAALMLAVLFLAARK